MKKICVSIKVVLVLAVITLGMLQMEKKVFALNEPKHETTIVFSKNVTSWTHIFSNSY